MADSFSPLLNLRLQQAGGNVNSWGDLLNTDTITPLENAVVGMTSRAVTGGTLDLSATPLVNQVQKFTGVLASDQTVIIPNLSKAMKVYNNTSGAFAMLLKTTAGTAVAIPQGTFKDIYCDGSNNVFRMDAIEVGKIDYFAGTVVPAGHVECDGSAISRANYPDLFAAISTTWGAGNGATTFNLPDFKTAGRFIRSRTGSVVVGTLQADTVGAHNHPASGTVSGSVTLSIAADGAWTPSISISDPGHSHQYFTSPNMSASAVIGSGITNVWGNSTTVINTGVATTGISASSNTAPTHAHAGSTASFSGSTSITVSNNTGTTETRPINASALCCIRF